VYHPQLKLATMNLDMIQAAQVQQQQQLARHCALACLEGSPTAAHHCALPMNGASGRSDQIGSAAMLVGTVAALQEEGLLMRSQYQSDVCRLDRELQELRSAAASALPHLRQERAEIQLESNFSAPCLLAESCAPRVSTLLEPSVRLIPQLDSLAPLTPTSSAGPCMPRHSNAFGLPLQEQNIARTSSHGTSPESAQIVELYKELERMSLELQQKTQENAKLKEELQARDAAHARDVSVLEELSIALQQKTAENAQLKEEMEACEVAHARDIRALEDMIQPLTNQNKNVAELGEAYNKLSSSKLGNIDDSVMSIYTVSTEPAKEPEVETSPSIDLVCSQQGHAQMRTPRQVEIMSRLEKVRA